MSAWCQQQQHQIESAKEAHVVYLVDLESPLASAGVHLSPSPNTHAGGGRGVSVTVWVRMVGAHGGCLRTCTPTLMLLKYSGDRWMCTRASMTE